MIVTDSISLILFQPNFLYTYHHNIVIMNSFGCNHVNVIRYCVSPSCAQWTEQVFSTISYHCEAAC